MGLNEGSSVRCLVCSSIEGSWIVGGGATGDGTPLEAIVDKTAMPVDVLVVLLDEEVFEAAVTVVSASGVFFVFWEDTTG